MSDSDNRRYISVITEGDDLPSDPVIEFSKRKVDRAALRENLKLTVTQRLEKLMERLRKEASQDKTP